MQLTGLLCLLRRCLCSRSIEVWCTNIGGHIISKPQSPSNWTWLILEFKQPFWDTSMVNFSGNFHITTPCFAEAILQISGSAGILSSWKTWGMSSLLYSRNTTWTRPILTFACTNRLDLRFSTYPLENYQRYIIIKIKSDSTCIFRDDIEMTQLLRDSRSLFRAFFTLSSLTLRRFLSETNPQTFSSPLGTLQIKVGKSKSRSSALVEKWVEDVLL